MHFTIRSKLTLMALLSVGGLLISSTVGLVGISHIRAVVAELGDRHLPAVRAIEGMRHAARRLRSLSLEIESWAFAADARDAARAKVAAARSAVLAVLVGLGLASILLALRLGQSILRPRWRRCPWASISSQRALARPSARPATPPRTRAKGPARWPLALRA